MKKLAYLITFLIALASCEEVVELDLNSGQSRLVIDARIELRANGSTNAVVLLTRSADFYVEQNPQVTDARVVVIDENGIEYNFNHEGDGIYINRTLEVEEDVEYTLDIEDQGQVYTSTEILISTIPLVEVQQETITGFGDDLLRLTAFYNDPSGLGDFYLFEYEDNFNRQVDIGDDEFLDGNRAPTIFFIEDFEEGDTATIKINGIDQRCYTFYETLLGQDGGGGNPFDAPPANVRGNIINASDADGFPFGYFRISQVFEIDYVIQSTEE